MFLLPWVRGKISSTRFVWWLSSKESSCQCRRHRRYESDPWVRKIPWRRKWQPTPVFLPGESHGVGYSPWGHQQSDMTEDSTTDTPCAHIWDTQVPGDCQSPSLWPWCHGDQTPICWISPPPPFCPDGAGHGAWSTEILMPDFLASFCARGPSGSAGPADRSLEWSQGLQGSLTPTKGFSTRQTTVVYDLPWSCGRGGGSQLNVTKNIFWLRRALSTRNSE